MKFEEYLNEVKIKLGQRYTDKSDEYVKAVYAHGAKVRNGVRIRAGGTSVYVELVPFFEKVHIAEISMPNSKQGSGIGHTIMGILTKIADEMKVTLGLFPSPIAQGLNQDQISQKKLEDFYRKHGFVKKAKVMEREPK